MANTQWTKDPDHGFIWNSIEHFFYWKENRERHEVNRKKYLRLCILGAFGAHQFYAKRPVLGVLYLARLLGSHDHRGCCHRGPHEAGRERQHLAVTPPLLSGSAGTGKVQFYEQRFADPVQHQSRAA